MQSDSVMLQFQPVFGEKKSIGGTFRSRSIDAFFAQDEAIRQFFVNWRVININQSTGQLLAGYFCLFVCLFVCFPLFFSSQKFTREFVTHSAHHISIRMSFHHRVSLAELWLLSAIFNQTAFRGEMGWLHRTRFPATSRGVRTFSVVFLFILPRPSLEFRRRWKPPEPAAKMEVAPRWEDFLAAGRWGFSHGL